MSRLILVVLALVLVAFGALVLVSYPAGGIGGIGDAPRPLPPGRMLIELESSTSRASASDQVSSALTEAVNSVYPSPNDQWEIALSKESAAANYVVWNRLYCQQALTLKRDADFDALLEAWNRALTPAFAGDGLSVLVEYQPLDQSAPPIEVEWTVE